MKHIILSRYEEPLLFELEQFLKFSDYSVTIYNKSPKTYRALEETFLTPNIGFEVHSYLRWMIDNHDDLTENDIAIFSQYDDRPYSWAAGSPGFTFTTMAKRALIAGASAEIVHQSVGHFWKEKHYENDWWRDAIEDLGIELPKHVIWPQGSAFAIRGDILKAVPIERLERALDFTLNAKSRAVRHRGPRETRYMAKLEAVTFERIWFVVLGIKNIWPIKSMGWSAWNKLPPFAIEKWMWPKEPYNINERGEEIDRMIVNGQHVVMQFDPADGWGVNSIIKDDDWEMWR
jgi:hypothetical protein